MGRIRIKLLGCLVVVVGLGIAAMASTGAASQREKVTIEFPPEIRFNAGFSTSRLAKPEPTPVSLTLSSHLATLDGTPPPRLKELVVDFDRNIAFDFKGFPICRISQDMERTVREVCRDAIVGEGAETIEIQFPESPPIQTKSRLTILNGGIRNGARTLFLWTYIGLPVPASLVSTVAIQRIDEGRYGTRMTISFPIIAGEGSIVSLAARIHKNILLDGKQLSPITAKCTDGKLEGRYSATLEEFKAGATIIPTGAFLHPCTGK